MTRLLPLTFSVIFLSLTGCRTTPEPSPVPAEADPAERAASAAPAAVSYSEEGSWPRLFLSGSDLENERLAFSLNGLAVTAEEYEAGLEALAEECEVDLYEARPDFEDRLRDELMILAWLERTNGENGGAEDEARRLLRATLADWALQHYAEDRVAVTEAEIQQYFSANPEQFTQPPRVAMRMILVPSRADAETILTQLQEGTPFDDLARERSLHSSAEQGGEVEPFARGTWTSSVEDLAFQLSPGETGTVESNRGVYVIEKIAEIRETVTSLEDVREQIREKLLREKRAAAREAFLRRVRASFPTNPQNASQVR